MSQNKVEMESDPFNRQFKVITSDDELAFYILTPQFMEHIVAADEKVDGYTKIEFENSRVTLALNNGKNSFELTKTLWSKSRLDETRLRFRYELNSILSIVDDAGVESEGQYTTCDGAAFGRTGTVDGARIRLPYLS